jgi:hypothetical protein
VKLNKKLIKKRYKKIKQIEIKRTRTKIKTKNKLNDTFIFWQGEERDKREKRRKKIQQNPNTSPFCTHAALIGRKHQDAFNVAPKSDIWRWGGCLA